MEKKNEDNGSEGEVGNEMEREEYVEGLDRK